MVPLCFILPILMWTLYNKDVVSRKRKLLNWALIAVFSGLAVVATVGSGAYCHWRHSSFRTFCAHGWDWQAFYGIVCHGNCFLGVEGCMR
jgi:hypothetical protein